MSRRVEVKIIYMFAFIGSTLAVARHQHTAVQPFVFKTKILRPSGNLVLPVANNRPLSDILDNADYLFEAVEVIKFSNGSSFYDTTTTVWKKQLQLNAGPLRVCAADANYYQVLPQASHRTCITSPVKIPPNPFVRFEMAVMNDFVTKQNYNELKQLGATNIIIPLTDPIPTGSTTFDIILYPARAFNACTITHTGNKESLSQSYLAEESYGHYTFELLRTYNQPMSTMVDIICHACYQYTPEDLAAQTCKHWTEVKQKLNISLLDDPVVVLPELPNEQLVITQGTTSATILVQVYSLHQPVDLAVQRGSAGEVIVNITMLTSTSTIFSVHLKAGRHNSVLAGTYTVKAMNTRGQDASRSISVIIAKEPELFVDPVLVRAEEGCSVSFACLAVSTTPVTIKWSRNYSTSDLGQVMSSHNLLQHQTGAEVTIKDIQLSDSGVLVCSAHSTGGVTYKEARLLVYPKGSTQVEQNYKSTINIEGLDTVIEGPVPVFPPTESKSAMWPIAGPVVAILIIITFLVLSGLVILMTPRSNGCTKFLTCNWKAQQPSASASSLGTSDETDDSSG